MATKPKPIDTDAPAPAEATPAADPSPAAADPVPQAGGCYVRQPDGQLAAATTPDTTTE